MVYKKSKFSLLLSVITFINVWSQDQFLNLEDFQEPLGAWFEAGNAIINSSDEKKLTAIKGKGILISELGKTKNLIMKQGHGDIQLELEFMLPKGSNSGVYLQGRYEIQILDSWSKKNPGSGDCGGIYARYDGTKTYEGTPPLRNASEEPGKWQHLYIRFNAPRFDDKGEKIKNAIFKKVKLNGILVQKNSEITGPTASSHDNREEPLGSLMLQGDHGPVAYRAITIKKK